jgi:hypothetical protein
LPDSGHRFFLFSARRRKTTPGLTVLRALLQKGHTT